MAKKTSAGFATGPGSMKLKGLGAPPPQNVAPTNMVPPSTLLKPLNFKVPEEFHRSYKLASATTGKSMVEILEESFKLWAGVHMKD